MPPSVKHNLRLVAQCLIDQKAVSVPRAEFQILTANTVTQVLAHLQIGEVGVELRVVTQIILVTFLFVTAPSPDREWLPVASPSCGQGSSNDNQSDCKQL